MTKQLKELLKERILVLDGAMGTMLQQMDLTAHDFGGEKYEGCNENLVLTRPDVIFNIHCQYLKAGSDIVETNTFGATKLVLADYGLQDKADEINKKAVELAHLAANEFSTPKKPRFVAGAMGPTTKAISVTGGVTFDQLVDNFYCQTKSLLAAGVDLLFLETCQDTRNIKAGVIGINKASKELGLQVPLVISGTIEPMGTMLAGQTAEALIISLSHVDLLAIGLNCATGPEFMTDHIRTLHELAPCGVSCYPNAGLPNEEGKYLETPESLAKQLERFVDKGWLNLVGGCCGTTEKYIRAIAKMVDGKKARVPPHGTKGRSFYSGIDVVEATSENRPLLVGERTNIIGSRAFKELIEKEKWDEASDIAKRQIKNGAQIIDVCLMGTDKDEIENVDPFYSQLTKKIKAPMMIDTTDSVALEKALTYCQGKSIINSINLEDGEDKFEKVCPLIKKYGAAVVVGTIDDDKEQAQAFTRKRKLEVAEKSYKLLTEKYHIPEEDIIFDPLVFPCATGDQKYVGGALETIEGIKLIKEKFPRCKTLIGVSNVSFGLPQQAREVINSVFLYHCTQAGLDLAIVNAEKLERYAQIPENEKKMVENLLFNSTKENITLITEHFREKKMNVETQDLASLSVDDRLSNYIIEGSKDGLIADLDLKLKEDKPINIINGPLMKGMAQVGQLFNKNELIVAEVLQSAEIMKASVTYLEQFIKKEERTTKGKFLLATVKGDVHDIGKNLVEIILKNNGYDVINLGIKVSPDEIVQACKKHAPDIIGLSGLLVKSTQQMAITVEDLKEAGITVPILVGGAALSDTFTRTKIAPHYTYLVLYAKDAMTGLDLANKLMNPKSREILEKSRRGDPVGRPNNEQTQTLPLQSETTNRSKNISLKIPIPPAPYLTRKTRCVPQLEEIWSYINPQMLFVRHLGLKGNFEKQLTDRDPRALELHEIVEQVKGDAKKFMKIKAVWQFFEAEPDGNSIHLFKPKGKNPIHTYTFNRQRTDNGLCLADYVLPPNKKGNRDHVALFVVSAGEGIREKSAEYKNKGWLLKSHVVQALALETAEACAEWLHRRIREDWGFSDSAKMTMMDRFQAKYRGKRYSFGYPACPNLDNQKGIWKLLRPENIGVTLTDGMMMDPEASVSALVFHHPDCVYFGVGTGEH